MSVGSRSVWARAPHMLGVVCACVVLFLAPVKFGVMQTDATHELLSMPQGVWEWLFFSYPARLLAWFVGLTAGCAAVAAAQWRTVRLPRTAWLGGMGWLIYVVAIFLADRRVPAAWVDHDAQTAFLLYGAWMMSAWALVARVPWRTYAAYALVTAVCVVAVEALQQYAGGLERMREYAARKAGFESFVAYTNFLLQSSTDAATVLLVKKLVSQRVYSTFVYPNALGGFLVVALPVAVAFAWQGPQRLVRMLGWLACAGGGAALMLSRSKASIVLGGMALLGQCWLAWRARVLSARAMLLWSIVVVGGVLGMLSWGYGAELGERLQATGGARLDYWRAALRIIAQRPWRGWGTGGFARAYPVYRCTGAEDTRLAHNLILNTWTDYGILGVAGLTLALSAPLAAGWRRVMSNLRQAGNFDWLRSAAVVAVSACLMHCMVDFDFHIPGIMLPALWLTACAGASAP